MNKKQIDSLPLYLHHKTLDNGLNVYIVPDNTKAEYKIQVLVNFGGMHYNYYDAEKKIQDLPKGIAHYLEHVMCIDENSEDAREFFNKSAASFNAATGATDTKYYCSGIYDFDKNLKYLLHLVHKPNIDDKTVEIERQIILEELKRSQTDTGRIVNEHLRRNLFHEPSYYESILGNTESLKNMTKEDLNSCHDLFYAPNNMNLIITGNVNLEETETLIDNIEKEFERGEIAEIIIPIDKTEVVTPEKEIKIRTSIPYCEVIYKIDINELEYSKEELLAALRSINISNFSGFTDFSLNLLKEQKISTAVSFGSYIRENFLIIYMNAESNFPDDIVKIFDDKIKNLEIDEEIMNISRKSLIGNALRASNYPDAINDKITGDLSFYGYARTDHIKFLNEFDIHKVKEILSKLRFDNRTILKAMPED